MQKELRDDMSAFPRSLTSEPSEYDICPEEEAPSPEQGPESGPDIPTSVLG